MSVTRALPKNKSFTGVSRKGLFTRVRARGVLRNSQQAGVGGNMPVVERSSR
jgi:hypothetical protein